MILTALRSATFSFCSCPPSCLELPAPLPDGRLQAYTRRRVQISGPFAEAGTTVVVTQTQPMFDEIPDPLVIHDPLTSQIADLWNSGNQELCAIAKACDVHIVTVRRKLRDCGLS